MRKVRRYLKVCSILILLLPTISATPNLSNYKTNRGGSISQHQNKRLARSPQTFGNSFDPIPVDEVNDHFGLSVPTSGLRSRENPIIPQDRATISATLPSNSRSLFSEFSLPSSKTKKSTPVRFPDPRDEDQLLLSVMPFPEESLATRQDPVLSTRQDHVLPTRQDPVLSTRQDPVLSDFLRIKSKPSGPRSLADSFGEIGEGLQKPRLHLPMQRDSNRNVNLRQRQKETPRSISRSINAKTRIQDTLSQSRLRVTSQSNVARNTPTQLPSTSITSKPITNPLLQKLFNRNSIPVVTQTLFQDPKIASPDNIQPTQASGSLFKKIQNRINEGQNQRIGQAQVETGNGEHLFTKFDTERSQPALSESQIYTEQQRLRQQILEQQKEQNNSPLSQTQLFGLKKTFKPDTISSVESQRDIDEKKEKEKVLMDALVQQRVKQELERRKNEERFKQEQERKRLIEEATKIRQENRRLKSKEEEEDRERRKRLEEEKKKRIQVANKRERLENLERITEKEKIGNDNDELRIRNDEDSEQDRAVKNALEAVRKRTDAGSDKSSPSVWAAVKALTAFIDSRKNIGEKPDVPQNILMAINHLTQFLLSDVNKKSDYDESEIINAEQVESFMKTLDSSVNFEIKRLATRIPFRSDTTTKTAFFRRSQSPKVVPERPRKASVQTSAQNRPNKVFNSKKQTTSAAQTSTQPTISNTVFSARDTDRDTELRFPLLTQFNREPAQQRTNNLPQQQQSNDSRFNKFDKTNQFGQPLIETRQLLPSPDTRQLLPSPDTRQLLPSPDTRQLLPSQPRQDSTDRQAGNTGTTFRFSTLPV